MQGNRAAQLVQVYFETPCRLWLDIVIMKVKNVRRLKEAET